MTTAPRIVASFSQHFHNKLIEPPRRPNVVTARPRARYAYDALEPHIDAATMKFHHDKVSAR